MDADREAAREVCGHERGWCDICHRIATALATARAEGREQANRDADSLRMELVALEQVRLRDNAYLISERDTAYARGWRAAIEAAAQTFMAHLEKIAPEQAHESEGAQIVEGQWHMLLWGCDTVQNALDAIRSLTPPTENKL